MDVQDATVLMTLQTEEKNLSKALAGNREKKARLDKMLTGLGIDSKKVTWSKFSSTPQYGLFGEKPKGYNVLTTIGIKISSEKEFELVAGLTDSVPELLYNAIDFSSATQNDSKNWAIEAALREIEKKKLLFERSLQMKLVPVAFFTGDNMEESNEIFDKEALYMHESSLKVKSFERTRRHALDQLVFKATVTVEYRAVSLKDIYDEKD